MLALSALRNLLLSPAALVCPLTFVAPNIPATEPQAEEGGGGCGDAQAQREEEEEEEGGGNSGSGVEVSRQGSVAGGLGRGREAEAEEAEEEEIKTSDPAFFDKEGSEILKRRCFKEGAHVLVELLCAVVKQGSASSLRNLSTVLYDHRKRRYMMVHYVLRAYARYVRACKHARILADSHNNASIRKYTCHSASYSLFLLLQNSSSFLALISTFLYATRPASR